MRLSVNYLASRQELVVREKLMIFSGPELASKRWRFLLLLDWFSPVGIPFVSIWYTFFLPTFEPRLAGLVFQHGLVQGMATPRAFPRLPRLLFVRFLVLEGCAFEARYSARRDRPRIPTAVYFQAVAFIDALVVSSRKGLAFRDNRQGRHARGRQGCAAV